MNTLRGRGGNLLAAHQQHDGLAEAAALAAREPGMLLYSMVVGANRLSS